MPGGQFPGGGKDEAHAPTCSAVVRGGRREDQEQRVISREGDSAIVSLIQWPDGPMNWWADTSTQMHNKVASLPAAAERFHDLDLEWTA